MGGEICTQGDVYSYGILLLEMFTGKRPTDEMFKDGLSLHNFCKIALPNRVLEIVDSRLLLELEGSYYDDDDKDNEDDNEEDVIINYNVVERRRESHKTIDKMRKVLGSIIRIGVVCSSEIPSDRISMNEVIMDLQVAMDMFVE